MAGRRFTISMKIIYSLFFPPPPPAQEFYRIWTLPKCISFLKMGGKVNVVISKVLGSNITNLKTDKNLKWRIQYCNLSCNISINSGFFFCNWLENSYSGVSAVPSFWILRFWLQVRNQRLQKPPTNRSWAN